MSGADRDAVVVRREIAAPAADLFDAWLDADSLGTWMRPPGIGRARAETDPRVGGSFRIVMDDAGSDLVHVGTYREIDRPHRLVFTWSSPATGHRDTLVTVTFRESAGSTVVEVHQVGLPDDDARASHERGWSTILGERAGAVARPAH